MSDLHRSRDVFDEILGLPAHPLIIHAAVMFAPLLAALSVAYVVLPRWRRRMGWAVVLLAVATPGAVFAAKESGEALKERLLAGGALAGTVGQRVDQHESFAGPLLLASAGLGVVSLLLVYASTRIPAPAVSTGTEERAEPPRARSGSFGGTTVTMVLSVVTILLALVVGYYVVRVGHSGAIAVWGS